MATLNVVTGASRGIGAALADRLPGETIRTSTAGGEGLVPLDLVRPDFAPLLAALDGRPLDLLVCNAGVYPDRGETMDGYPPEMWAEGLAVNVTGVFLTIQALLPALKAAKGRIGVISSQMGSTTRAPGGSYLYRASKAAATNLARNLAADLAPEGVAVAAYHPGWVRTDMGGPGAENSVDESADGLAARLAALSLASTGAFETWDGRPHPY